jgi:hypothetical protein
MVRSCWPAACATTVALVMGATVAVPVAMAQQQRAPWQTETNAPLPTQPTPDPAVSPSSVMVPPNTTVVPRSAPPEAKAAPGVAIAGQVSLVAVLTQDGQNIEQGLVWRVFRDKPGPDGKLRLVSAHREASPTLRLDPGDYVVNVAFGRAHLTRKISVSNERASQERFVLNAGGLRITPALPNGEAVTDKTVSYEIFSDERDQYGQRTRVTGGLRPGTVVRLNAGIYSIVSTYGDANAVARADVTVEAGKLTEAKLSHAAASVTLKLVARSGGDAIADAQWSIATKAGEAVKESVGALPTHILAPGTYVVSARHAGQVYQREFTVKSGDFGQVEVVIQ